ncbi:MAG: tail fiber domain-containing protein [Candidatus Omnitrophica bacterium]|nr:tail fiber domain-containing protein [Candidatus Omnitrophota bacterium]
MMPRRRILIPVFSALVVLIAHGAEAANTIVYDAYYPAPTGAYATLSVDTTLVVGTNNVVTPGLTLDVNGTIALNHVKTLRWVGNNLVVGDGGNLLVAASALNNTFVGFTAGWVNTIGSYNTMVGQASFVRSSTAGENTGAGYEALFAAVGTQNSALGNLALYGTGSSPYAAGSFNTAAGSNALANNMSGASNVAVGANALNANVAGAQNTALGNAAMNINYSGTDNVGMGDNALMNTKESGNVAIGSGAGSGDNGGNHNYSYNVFIGTNAGDSVKNTASGNIVIGDSTDLISSTGDDQLVIANTIYGSKVNRSLGSSGGNIGIGTTSPGYTLDVVSPGIGGSAFSTVSDRRLKEHVSPLTGALAKVRALQGVNYTLKKDSRRGLGLIGQDVERVLPEVVLVDKKGYRSIEYGNIAALLIEAVKEQHGQVDRREKQVNDQQARIDLLQRQVMAAKDSSDGQEGRTHAKK